MLFMENKKLLLLFTVSLLAVLQSQGQTIKKGSIVGLGSFGFMSGTSASFSAGSGSSTDYVEWDLGPSAQYYFIEDLGIGIRITAGVDRYKNTYESPLGLSRSKTTYSTLTAGPVVRYYLAKRFFGQIYGGYGYQAAKSVSSGVSSGSKYSMMEFEVGVGYSLKIHDAILLDGIFGLGGKRQKYADDFLIKGQRMFAQIGFAFIIAGRDDRL
jgi:hypothetical protein